MKEKQKKQTDKKKNVETRETNERKFLKNLQIVYTSCRWLGPRKFELRIQKKVFLTFSSSLSLFLHMCYNFFSLLLFLSTKISFFLFLSLSLFPLPFSFFLCTTVHVLFFSQPLFLLIFCCHFNL